MKFMKLGSRPDTFYATESVRSVSSEVSSDLIIQVKGSRYLLHKFPLLSKSLRLQTLCLESPEASQIQIVQIPDFPAGLEAFEVCAKFCYGITITLSAYNLVSVRCAAEYLQMTEDVEKGNLMYKIEVFFNSCILHGWRDSIVTLQTTKAFPLLSEDLGITGRCIESIASKVLTHPTKVNLSHNYSRQDRDNVSCKGSECRINKAVGSNKGWWGEDVVELGIDLYWRTMIAIKGGGKVPSNLIGDALRIYASRWLPSVPKFMDMEKDAESDRRLDLNGEKTLKPRLLLESIVSLLPAEKTAASCSFLLKLLKAANILKASSSTKMELVKRVGVQLDEATVGDLLIPSLTSKNGLVYDVDTVLNILEQFTLQGQSPPISPSRIKKGFERRRSRSVEDLNIEFNNENRRPSSASHSSKLKVGKLLDKYLQEIARDKNLSLPKFIVVAKAIPEFSRLAHDDLYKAVDIYLKVHVELNKSERKSLCCILDCKKLSVEACMHAAQNEMLPLRVVVQVLFFEQARTAQNGGLMAELPSEIKALLAAHMNPLKHTASFGTNIPAADHLSMSGQKSPYSNVSTQKMKPVEENNSDANFPVGVEKSSKLNSLSMVPDRPKRMLGKLWPINRSAREKN